MALDHRLAEELADAAPLLTVHLAALEELQVLRLSELFGSLLDVVGLLDDFLWFLRDFLLLEGFHAFLRAGGGAELMRGHLIGRGLT